MTVLERSSLIQKLYNRADETIPDNPYKKARQRGYREAFETVLSARTVEAERVVYCKDCRKFNRCNIAEEGDFGLYDFCSLGGRR